MQRRRPEWTLILLVLAASLLVSCESTNGPEDTGPPATPSVVGGIAGYVYSDADLEIVSAPAGASVGAAPVAGGEVIATHAMTGTEYRTTTGDDGSFGLSSLSPGLYQVEARTNRAAKVAAGTVMISVIAGAQVSTGELATVSREDAFGLLENGAGAGHADALILGTMQPLPAGAVVSAPSPPEGYADIRELPADAWFFLVDLHPLARLGHELEYVFVDAESGAVTRHTAYDTPVVNGSGMWYSDLTWFVYEDFEAPGVPPYGGPLPPGPTAEVLQVPEIEAPPAATAAGVGPGPRLADIADSSDPNDWFYLGVSLDTRGDFVSETVDMSIFMEAQGVPDANRRGLLSYSHLDVESFDAAYRSTREYLQERIEQRVAQQGKPTLFVFINGHHGTDAETGIPSRMISALLANGDKIFKKSWFWNLEEFEACKVVLIMESCYAHLLTQDVIKRFESKDVNDRPELVAFASSAGDEYSWAYSVYAERAHPMSIRAGGHFAIEFLKRASIVDGGIVGVTSAPGVLIPSLATVSDSWFKPQHGQLDLLPAAPAWCEVLENVVTVDKQSVVYESPDRPTQPCARLVGSFVLTSQTELQVDVTIESSNLAIQTDPRDAVVFDGNSRTVLVLYNCKQPPPVEATISVIATSSNGYVDTTEVAVTIHPPIAEVSTEFDVRAPSVGGSRQYEMWIPVPVGAEIVRTSLIDLATGEAPSVRPWPQSTASFSIAYEGRYPEDESYYGIIYVLDDPLGQGCPDCPVLKWRYTVSYGQ